MSSLGDRLSRLRGSAAALSGSERFIAETYDALISDIVDDCNARLKAADKANGAHAERVALARDLEELVDALSDNERYAAASHVTNTLLRELQKKIEAPL